MMMKNCFMNVTNWRQLQAVRQIACEFRLDCASKVPAFD